MPLKFSVRSIISVFVTALTLGLLAPGTALAGTTAAHPAPHVFGHALGSDCLPPQTGLFQHRETPPHAFDVNILGHGVLRCKQRPDSITSQLCIWQHDAAHHAWHARDCSRFRKGVNARLEQRIGLRMACRPGLWQTEWDFWNLRTSSGVPNPPESHCSDVVHFGCNPPARTVRRLLNPKRTHICIPHGAVPPASTAGSVTPAVLAAKRTHNEADCEAVVHMLKRVKNSVAGTRIYRQAKAIVYCFREPIMWNSQIFMQRWNKNLQRWDWVGAGPIRHRIPVHRDQPFWLNKPCAQGRFRAGFGAWGTSSSGTVWPENIIYSKALRIANCRA